MPDTPKRARNKAVAIKYKPLEQSTPSVVAKGAGNIADKIVQIAREHGIPVREDPDLVETLSKLDIDEEVPPELYHVIAEVLAWVYKVNGKYGEAK